ncbi:multidrug resistance-associated protein 7 isoform X4 [Rhinopithecus roxellana]|uniref:multidrug resistance-associated protein 7 isoform X4 n=1 Tax=Rhinopithecus roxellana TaxID=61622 RepID=UPI0012373DE2|nr:multidrug resistance-associated protein 7 isoform X4 [Rhinopithecus roxellana]
MERLLAQLCGSSAAWPLPLWEGDTTGHCFTQLVLSALPHALLAVLSACYLGTPRSPDYILPCSPGWRLRLAASFLLSVFPLLDLFPVALPPGAGPGPIGLEVLAGGVAAVAWISHSLALWVLSHSPHGHSRGPLALALVALLPAPALVLTVLWHCQRGTLLPPLLPGPVARLCLLILQLAALLAYALGWAAPGGPREPWAQEPLLPEDQEPEVAEDGESWLSHFSYAWLAPLLTRGACGELQKPQDICRLPHRLHPTYLARVFQSHWQEGARLWRALYGAFGWCYLALGLLKLLVTELLSGIRVIKLCGWEQALGARVEACRARELGRLRVIKYLDAACVYLWAALPVVISIVIFITYVLMGHQLTATKVFTALALVQMLILPLNNFPWVINGLLEAKVSLDRIQLFLDLPNHNPQAYYSPDPPAEPSTVLELHGALFSWDPLGTSQETFIGHLEVKKGMLVGIVGKVGCGKSSLLAAIAGELHRLRGRVAVWGLSKGFGLATQEPWIQFATIRDNILFGKTFDAQLYKEVLEACALDDDLSILPAGDQTEVGEKGVTLSGGQRARIALARAVYQEKDLYLLDDPLAAVDADVANHLLHRCILGVLSHSTRLLCTHRTEYLERADVVLLMEAGRLIRAGPPSEILPLVQPVPKAWAENGQKSDSATAQSVQNPEKTKEGLEEEQSTSGGLLQEESKKEGAVALHVYQAYWKAVGQGLALAILFSLLLMQATRNAADWWLSHWISQLKAENSSQEAQASTSPASTGLFSPQLLLFSPGNLYTPVFPLPKAAPNGSSDIRFYLTVYATIAGVNSLCTLLRAVLFAAGTLEAAATLHRRLLHRVLMAPVTFFNATPTGRILNRFSSDVACVDDSLPFILNILLANAAGLLGLLAVLGSGLPWLLLLLPPLSIIYYHVQRHYRASSRELRRLGSLTLSPLYTHLADTLAGLSVLRAAGATYRFEEENQRLLELNQRCQFATSATMQWLDIRLQLMGAAVVSAIAGIALVQHQQGLANPGLVGLSLSYALSLTGLLSGLVSSFTQTEAMLVSVERLEEYSCDLPQEPQGQPLQLGTGWLTQGGVEFQDVVLVYRPGLPNALDGVTFCVQPGEKLGIVGRTGSGKSSLLLVLFRLLEPSSGRVLLDGVDISQLELAQLRSQLAIIPQEPFLFSGTVRENLDPRGLHKDRALWQALEHCHLSEVINSMGGLDGELGEGGRSLSLGQRQLLCLARALLTDAKILCIDEATASVDQKTDQLLQQTICKRFANKTVLTIAHRLNTILNSDRVLVLQAGRVVELDSPATLRNQPHSLFQQLLQSSQQGVSASLGGR